jgi:hypothetical protein
LIISAGLEAGPVEGKKVWVYVSGGVENGQTTAVWLKDEKQTTLKKH